MSKTNGKFEFGLVAIIVLLIVGVGGCNIAIPRVTQDTVTAKVTDKERITDKDSSKYLIFTETETFENSDILSMGKFNSSDIYGTIKKDKTYKFTVCGWRIGFLSAYRNIIRVEEVITKTKE